MFHCSEARTVIPRFTSSGHVLICHVDSPNLSIAHLVELYFYQLLRRPTHLAHLISPQRGDLLALHNYCCGFLSSLTFACTLLVMSFPELCVSFHMAQKHPQEADLCPFFNSSLMKSAVKMMHKMVLFLLKSKPDVNLFGENFTNMQDIPKIC